MYRSQFDTGTVFGQPRTINWALGMSLFTRASFSSVKERNITSSLNLKYFVFACSIIGSLANVSWQAAQARCPACNKWPVPLFHSLDDKVLFWMWLAVHQSHPLSLEGDLGSVSPGLLPWHWRRHQTAVLSLFDLRIVNNEVDFGVLVGNCCTFLRVVAFGVLVW